MTAMTDLPGDINDPCKRREVLVRILENCNHKIAELQDRKELLEHEISMLGGQ